MEVREGQFSKGRLINVTLSGMFTEVKPEQPLKAQVCIHVTLLGIVIEVKLEQPKKASESMQVTPLGITVFAQPAINAPLSVWIMALQLSRES